MNSQEKTIETGHVRNAKIPSRANESQETLVEEQAKLVNLQEKGIGTCYL